MAEIYTKKEYVYIERKLGPKLCKLFSKLDAFLAGGSITSIFSNMPINDFDIFFRNEESYEKAVRYFKILVKVNDSNTKEICDTERATTYNRMSYLSQIEKMKSEKYGPSFTVKKIEETMTIQLVNPKFVCGTPEEVFMGFDFTVCMGAYLFKEGRFEFDKAFLKDLSRRELIFNPSAVNLVSSLFRSIKYKSRGFTMSTAEEMKLALCLGSKKFSTFGEFIKSGGSVMSEEAIQHLFNCIRYPNEEKYNEKDSLMDTPYDVNAIIEWLGELVHSDIYYPKVSHADKLGIDFVKEKWSRDLEEILETDLSEAQIKDVIDKPRNKFVDLLDDEFIIGQPKAIPYNNSPPSQI